MKHLSTIVTSLAFVLPVFADALPQHADEVVRYAISVRLDVDKKQLDGHERLTWRNPSSDAITELQFHLYLNAFKNTDTTFFKESGGQLRGDEFVEGKWGWIAVKSMRLVDGADLTPVMEFIQPDDGNKADQTVLCVPLPQPVPSGGSISLDIDFLAQLPQVFARTGFAHDYFLAGQWFPKIGVYEPAGMRGRKTGGWNCHQFHATSEFYADYGHYQVDITVPAQFVLGATGVQTQRRQNSDGTVTTTYEQGDVHDFVWTASPRFIPVRRRFLADRDVSPEEYRQTAQLLGRTLEEVRLSDVDVTVLMQPNHMPQAERHVSAAIIALKYFGLWYGRYPYPTLTVVDPGPDALGSGGMEYPTFITAGTSFLLNYWPFGKVRGPEGVTIHEFGHQFWYAMVGNNEFEEAWLDEGIDSYSTGKVMELAYGRDTSMVDMLGLQLGEVETIRMQNSPNLRFNRILQNAWSYAPLRQYSFYSYTKPELMLRTLEKLLGGQTMARVLRTFHERWRFRHPSSDDFFAVASEVAGQDLSEYFDATVRGTNVLDYEIGSVSSEKVKPSYGVFDRDGKTITVAKKEAEKKAKESEAPFESVILVRRRGEVIVPVEVELKFKGQPPERRYWDGKDRTITYRITRPEKLEWANVDPDRGLVLDVDWLNNSRRVESDGRVSFKYAARWMFWIQNLLALIGF